MTFIYLMPIVFWLGILGPGFYLAFRFLRAFEARSGNSSELEELRGRLARIEESMESMGADVQRIGEAQEFTTRLLGERSQSGSSTS